MLDRRNLAPVGYQRINKENGKEVPWDQIVKGYEYEEDKYVVLSDEDFRAANPKATQTVDILHFVPAQEVPFLLFETPYYLAPLKRGEKGYALLRDTLKRTGKVAVTQVVIRTRQYLAAMVPWEHGLILNTMRYPEELRSMEELELPGELKGAGVKNAEAEMALRLVDQMTEHWTPDAYRDTYRDDVLARIQEKIDAGETEVITEAQAEKAPPRKAEVIDLMALLKRSVEDKGRKESAQDAKKAHTNGGRKAPRTRQRAAAADKRRPAQRRQRA